MQQNTALSRLSRINQLLFDAGHAFGGPLSIATGHESAEEFAAVARRADTILKQIEQITAEGLRSAAGAGWRSLDTLPVVEPGSELHCFLLLERNHNGQQFVADAYYVNKPLTVDEEEEYPDWALRTEDGGYVELVGFAEKSFHQDFDGFYEPFDVQHRQILAWQPVEYPAVPAAFPIELQPPAAAQQDPAAYAIEMMQRVDESIRNALGIPMDADEALPVLVEEWAEENSLLIQAYKDVQADHRRLVRELDVLLNGEAGAAPQARLCDIVAQLAHRQATADQQKGVDSVCGAGAPLGNTWPAIKNGGAQ